MDFMFILQLLTVLFCGTIIGAERQLHGKPVGIRTSVLICLATMTFIDLSQGLELGTGSARVLGQIVTGVGFLGGGVIMSKEGLIVGATSAAVVWVLAAVGAAIGLNQFSVAITTSIFTVVVLIGVQHLENAFKALRQGFHSRPGKNNHKKYDG